VLPQRPATTALYNLLMATNYAARFIEGTLMPTWLRSLVNAFLGKFRAKRAASTRPPV
jgi:hypothetical protein